jgi:hypothetical protein
MILYVQSTQILYWRNKYRVILCYTANVLHTPFSIYATQIINTLPNSLISANHNEAEENSANMVKSLDPLLFLSCKISLL